MSVKRMTRGVRKIIKPLGDRILIEIKDTKAEKKTASGIVLPDSVREQPQHGKVVAVGSGRVNQQGERIPVSVSVGETVIFSKFAPTNIIDPDTKKEYLIISERDLIAVI